MVLQDKESSGEHKLPVVAGVAWVRLKLSGEVVINFGVSWDASDG